MIPKVRGRSGRGADILTPVRVAVLTVLAMLAFAANSLLCRLALRETDIDAASFTAIRVVSGALALAILVFAIRGGRSVGGSWVSALALFAYAAGFSFAYLGLTAATGALLLFGAVQCTMIGYGLKSGERMNGVQVAGASIAAAGLIGLLLPGLSAPPLVSAALMLGAGVAWGVYSLRGRGSTDGIGETGGNFVRAAPFALVLVAGAVPVLQVDLAGAAYAVASGVLASAMGYAVWYAVLPALRATSAATVQLTVPALAALGGVVLLGEPLTTRLILASLAILGGVALYILSKGQNARARQTRRTHET